MSRSVAASLYLSIVLSFATAWPDEPAVRRFVLPNDDTLASRCQPAGRTRWSSPGRRAADDRDRGRRGRAAAGLHPARMGGSDIKDIRELPQLRDAVRDLAERIQPEALEPYLEFGTSRATTAAASISPRPTAVPAQVISSS